MGIFGNNIEGYCHNRLQIPWKSADYIQGGDGFSSEKKCDYSWSVVCWCSFGITTLLGISNTGILAFPITVIPKFMDWTDKFKEKGALLGNLYYRCEHCNVDMSKLYKRQCQYAPEIAANI